MNGYWRHVRTSSFAVSLGLMLTFAVVTPAPRADASTFPIVTKVGQYPIESDGGGRYTEVVAGTPVTATVDFTGAAPGTYVFYAACINRTEDTTVTFDDTSNPGIVQFPVDTGAPASLFCSLNVQQNGSGGPDPVDLMLLDPQVKVSHFANPSGARFYPLVAGHRDSWTANFETNSPAVATMTVRDRSGRLIRSETFRTSRNPVAHANPIWVVSASWNGRRQSGRLVKVGTYRVRFIVKSTRGSGTQSIGPFRAVARPGRRPIFVTIKTLGYNSVTSTGGGCFAAPQIEGALWMDCENSDNRSDAFSMARWTARIRSDEKIIRWSFIGGVNSGPHAPGTISKTLTRTSSTRAVMQVRVTGRKNYTVESVSMTLRYYK